MSKSDPPITTPTSTHVADRFTDTLVAVLLSAALAVRLLVSDTYVPLEVSFLQELADQGVTPGTTVWLDGLTLFIAMVASWRLRTFSPVIIAGIGLLLASIILSTISAADQRVALNAGMSLIAMIIGAAALGGLVRRNRMLAIGALAALLAGVGTNAAKCLTQAGYEFADTREFWQDYKQELQQRGADLNDPTLIDYERRMASSEAFGYLAHPNVAGGLLGIGALIGLGIGVFGVRSASDRQPEIVIGAFAFAALCLLGVWFTGSMGAAVAVAAGAALLGVIYWRQLWFGRHALRMTLALAGLYFLGLGGLLGYGATVGTLPHKSLAFRWYYWSAALEAWQEHPITGVGRENFRAAYVQYKPPASTEEVANAHNLWLSLLSELGPLAVLGFGLLAATVFRRLLTVFSAGEHQSAAVPLRPHNVVPWAALAATLLMLQAIATRLWLTSNGAVVFLWAALTAGVWVVLFSTGIWILSGQRSAGVNAGMLAGTAAGLIHGLVSFGLLTPAGLALVAGGCAAVIGLRADEQLSAPAPPREKPARRWISVAALIVVMIGHFGMVMRPTLRNEQLLAEFTRGLRQARSADQAAQLGTETVQALAQDPLQSRQIAAVGKTLLGLARQGAGPPDARAKILNAAQFALRSAVARNPNNYQVYLWLADAASVEAELPPDGPSEPRSGVDAVQVAAAHLDTAVALNPTQSRLRIRAGDAAFRAWRVTGLRADADRAIDHFAAALAIDATREPEMSAKLKKRELQHINDRLALIEAALKLSAEEEPGPHNRPP